MPWHQEPTKDVLSLIHIFGLSSYKNATKSSGSVQITRDLQRDISGRDILVVEDIPVCLLYTSRCV